MHDQGPLPALKEGGAMAVFMGCAQLAKDFNDDFLTKCIEEEKFKEADIQMAMTTQSGVLLQVVK